MIDKATLLTDIHSYCKGLKLYGSKGEKVKVISFRGDVAIVEGKTRFSVKIEDLKINSKQVN